MFMSLMILIQNIYYMLSYAFKALKNEGYKNVQTEQFDNVKELLSEILILGLKTPYFLKYKKLLPDIKHTSVNFLKFTLI